MKPTALAILLLFALNLAADDLIRVVALRSDSISVFRCGDRCRFRGTVPQAVRLRIFRGTTAELAALGRHPGNTAAGCIEFDTTIVRPRRSRHDTSMLDLNFFFRRSWLAADGGNGQYVFVVERDDRPNDPEIERKVPLRLPTGATRTYFAAGTNVTVLAPTFRMQGGVAAARGREDAPSVSGLIAERNCVDVRIEPGAFLRSARSLRPIPTETVTRTAP